MSKLSAADALRERYGPYGQDIREPSAWPDDGGKRVEVITDPNWIMPDGQPRVIRRMGWRLCLARATCRFLSPDLSRQRICDYHREQRGLED